MLILTRRANERIHIGDNVVLVVLGIENNRVKLGIDAPPEVSILREEIVGDQSKAPKNKSGGSDALAPVAQAPEQKTGT